MNSVNSSWKCPNCDTLNTTRRCVVCGNEEPTVLPPELKNTITQSKIKKKSNKGLIIALCSVIGVLIAAIAVILIMFLSVNEEQTDTVTTNTHEAVDKDEEKNQETEKEDEYIVDPVYSIRFNLSVDKHEMDKKPGYLKESDAAMVYTVPKNFEDLDNGRYFAYDNTAHIRFTKSDVISSKTMNDLLLEEKSRLGGEVSLERLEENWYAISSLRNGVIYYSKAIMGKDYIISFMFVYPEEYRDIYDDYVDNIVDGFSLPDESGIEVIEE